MILQCAKSWNADGKGEAFDIETRNRRDVDVEKGARGKRSGTEHIKENNPTLYLYGSKELSLSIPL